MTMWSSLWSRRANALQSSRSLSVASSDPGWMSLRKRSNHSRHVRLWLHRHRRHSKWMAHTTLTWCAITTSAASAVHRSNCVGIATPWPACAIDAPSSNSSSSSPPPAATAAAHRTTIPDQSHPARSQSAAADPPESLLCALPAAGDGLHGATASHTAKAHDAAPTDHHPASLKGGHGATTGRCSMRPNLL